jgi:hypothetical protein
MRRAVRAATFACEDMVSYTGGLARHKEFRDRYISARDFQAVGLGEEMLEIDRDTSGDDLARARLRALERQAARMAPRKYGR